MRERKNNENKKEAPPTEMRELKIELHVISSKNPLRQLGWCMIQQMAALYFKFD